MSVLTIDDFVNVPKYYGIPAIRFEPQRVRLNASISHAELKFLAEYSDTGITVNDINENSELKEALKYYTFAQWLRAEWLERTPAGASVEKKQIKGTPKYDLSREIEALNVATDLMNTFYADVLDAPYERLKAFINY